MQSNDFIQLEKDFGSFNYLPLPIVISKGKGALVWSPENKEYIDFVGGMAACSQGHAHPKLIQAVLEQAQKITLMSRVIYSDQFGPFAKKITTLLGYERVLMMNTGAEAFETSTKIARKWGYETKKIPDGKAKILVCSDNFHGRTISAAAASSNTKHHQVFGPMPSGFEQIPFNNISALENALKDPNVCAFIIEPIQGEAGIVVPDDGYLESIYNLCVKSNVLLIGDEIQSGLGRTGKMLSFQHERVKPHITLIGKALSGGIFPISAVLANAEIMQTLQPGDHGSTFGGSPMACHVASTALDILVEENLPEKAQALGEIFRGLARELNSPLISEIRGKGLMNAIVFDPSTKYGADIGKKISLELLKNGVLAKETRPHIIRFVPPLVITESQIRTALITVDEILKRILRN